jgi:uncharacterized membrane protein YfcA
MRARRFDIPKAKRTVMLFSGIVLGFWSAVSGISGQSAAGPYVVFMLGYALPKANATAFMFAFWAMLGTIVAWIGFSEATPQPLLVVVMTAGATLGAVLAAKAFPCPSQGNGLRILRSLLVLAMVYVISDGVRSSFGGPRLIPWEILRTPSGWLLTGAVVGFGARGLQIPSGVLFVPGLVYGAGLPPGEALIASLTIAALSAVLPLIGYTMRREADSLVGPAFSIGGALGGAAGGFLVARAFAGSSTAPLIVYGITAMLLCSWLAYRSSE